MAVPRYESELSPVTGPLRVHAEPNLGVATGVGLIGRGLQDTAQAGAYMYNRSQDGKALRKQIDDERWAQDQFMKEKLKLAEMMAEDGMNTAEDIVERVRAFAETQSSQYTNDTAPSQEALDNFRSKYSKHVNDLQVASAGVEANNKINNGLQAIKNNTHTAILAFRSMAKFSEPLAFTNLIESVASQNASIYAMFGKNFPKIAHQLQEDLTTQAVLAAAEINPVAAATILKNAASIDEQTRAQLTNQIESAQRSSDSAARYRLEADRKDAKTLAIAGTRKEGMPLERYLSVYPKATAEELKRQDDREIDAYTQANTVINAVAPFNEEVQNRAVANLQNKANIGNSDDVLRAEATAKGIKQLQDFRREDIRGYLDAHNPVVIQARGNAKNSETTATYYDTVLSYQGSPPENASQAEASMHMSLPIADRHLLGKDTAKQLADTINLSTPQEVIKSIGELLSPYTKDYHKQVVFNDLVTMGKLNQQYQLVWQNKDAWWIGTFIGALKAGKDIKVPDTVRADIEKRLVVNPTWSAFQSSMIGDNFQRANEIGGFFTGIAQYASVLYATKGLSPKDAINTATKQLITETLGFTKVNERSLMILKERAPGLPQRTQEEIEDIGRRLGFVPQFIPLSEVDTTPWNVALAPISDQPDKVLEALSDELNARSFWQTTQDGQGAVLYAIDENNLQQFEVRDKQGNPFVVKFDDLPAFTAIREPAEMRSTVGYWNVPGVASAGKNHARHPGVMPTNKQGRASWLKSE